MSSLPDLLIEIGCEELPARMVGPALQGLRDGVLGLLEGVAFKAVRTYATPRRLAVVVEDLASGQPVVERELTGPPADKAFGPDGLPTEAGIAFARGRGAAPSDLRVVELPKRGRVAAVTIREGGRSAVELIAAGLGEVITRIPFAKSMIWGEGGLSFGRPLRWIVAVYGGEIIHGEAHGHAFGNKTWGHRLTPGPITVGNEAYWCAALRQHHVEPDQAVRRQRIVELLDEAQRQLGSDPIRNEELLDEVQQLVEWPVLVLGTFDEDLLGLPPRLLVTSMRVHQRYFPVFRDGQLTNRFVVISNNPFADADVVAEGNARVLRSRFHDARFFLREDQGRRLEEHGRKLANMRWIRGLGTMADKSRRIGALGARLSGRFGADPATVERAAALCKCDLPTQMVGEFPELQGHMGRIYAAHQGESPAVAQAIEEHYLPAFSGDRLPASAEGRALALAERLDTLVGCFGTGLEPKGGGDPQGLRRAAVGVIHLVVGGNLRVRLHELLRDAVRSFHAEARSVDGHEAWVAARGIGEAPGGEEALVARLGEFLFARWQAWQVERGRTADVVAAVLAASDAGDDLLQLGSRLDALAELAGTERFQSILLTFKRLLNIIGEASPTALSAEDCPAGVERDLRRQTLEASSRVSEALDRVDDGAALDAMLGLAAPVEAFFEGVLVLDPDPEARARRLGILSAVASLFGRVADFSRISTR